MNRIINLSDFSNNYIFENMYKSSQHYDTDLIMKSIENHKKKNLRHDNSTGRSYDNTGKISEYVGKFPVHQDEKEVIQWEFSGQINNSCSRYLRGYKL